MSFKFQPIPDRLQTYSVWSAAGGLIGYLRYCSSGDFIARTRGSADEAANIRRFTSQNGAAAWLVATASGIRRPVSKTGLRRLA